MPAKSVKKATVTKSSVTKKSPSKKIATSKVSSTEQPQEILSAVVLIKLWFEGWKKSFSMDGRSSRFELWTFMLVNSILSACIHFRCNYILSPRFLRTATENGLSLSQIDNYIAWASLGFYMVLVVPLIPIAALLVRRLHDIGISAWKHYLEPLCYATMTSAGLLICIMALEIENEFINSTLLLIACFGITLYAVGYYCLKFLITAMFYRGEASENTYGKSLYNTNEHERLALKLSCFYFLFWGTIMATYIITFILELMNEF